MSKMAVLAIRDQAVLAYLPPFVARTPAEGVRTFKNMVMSDQLPIRHHPDDYVLWHIADWDDNVAEFKMLVQPEKMISARQVVELNGSMFP